MVASYREDPLWLKLQEMAFDPPGTSFTFYRKVEAETGLTASGAAAAIAEYRKYIYLAMRASHSIMPPRWVEDVWKIHLTYTRHYWGTMCSKVLGHPLHYRSTAMLDEEFKPNIPFLERTAHFYEEIFGQPPPRENSASDSVFGYKSWNIRMRVQQFVILGIFAVMILSSGAAWVFFAGLLALVYAVVMAVWNFSEFAMTAPVRNWLSTRLTRWLFAEANSQEHLYRHDPLWKQIMALELENLGVSGLPLVAELAAATGWQDDYCQSACGEYRRFLYLAARAGHTVTPSDVVDEVWHLHLSHSQHYWIRLCGDIFGRPLHHNPATGRRGEGAMLRNQYRRTLNSYREIFGVAPPSGFWGSPTAASYRGVFNWGYGSFAVTFLLVHFVAHRDLVFAAVFAAATGAILALTAVFRQINPVTALFDRIREKKLMFAQKKESGAGGGCGAGCGGCGGCGG